MSFFELPAAQHCVISFSVPSHPLQSSFLEISTEKTAKQWSGSFSKPFQHVLLWHRFCQIKSFEKAFQGSGARVRASWRQAGRKKSVRYLPRRWILSSSLSASLDRKRKRQDLKFARAHRMKQCPFGGPHVISALLSFHFAAINPSASCMKGKAWTRSVAPQSAHFNRKISLSLF